jgi:hypothetical protein
MKPELHEEFMVLMQEQSYLDAPKPSRDLIKKMVDSANNVGEYAGSFSEHIGIIVIPAAHWSQVNDALNGMDIIKLQQKVGNNSQTWRLKNYHKILDEFKRIYRHPQPNYIFEEWPQLDGTDRDFISKTFNIEFTGKLDGRAGMGDVDELLPNEEAKNQVSGEPLETNSAISWSISDGNSKKQFAAYDWNKYHGKDADALKKATADEMKNGIGFYKAIQKAIESKNPSIKINADLINVAGVQDYTGDSSNTIGAKTNWINLANYFKIEHGVNNQGIELLKKTYQMFDGNFQGEFASEGHSIDRWLDGVKKAKQYIEKNYKESGGNYFRKDDAEGQPSGANYGNPSGPTVNDLQTQSEKPDYDKARTKHPGFNTMMQNGMQNYLVRGEVNDLVGFLNNPSNDNVFKSAVLNTLANRFEVNPGNPFNSFQDALAVTRRHGYESVFDKFEKLPLEEQLIKLQKIDSKKIDKVLEGGVKQLAYDKEWDRMHSRDNVQVSRPNPMKVVKPYNPAQHKEAMIKNKMDSQKITRQQAEAQIAAMLRKPENQDYFTANADKKRQDKKNNVTESVPNNTKVRMINKILSDHFPASDLKKQMDAYFAIPDPQMLKDFRKRRAEAGDDVCLRPILRNYIQMKLHPKLHSAINLNESKDDLIAKIDALPDDEGTKKLVNYIEQLIDDMGVGGKIQSLSNELEVIDDIDVKKAINQIAKIIASIEMSPQERAQLFVDWKADKLVNVDALLSTSTVSLETIFKGYGEKGESHVTELVDDLNQVVQYGIGPGEFALSVLSQRIEGIGASSGADDDGPEGKGDLLIDGKPIELKTTRKNSARFNDRQVTASDSYKSLVTAFFNKYDAKFKELEEQGLQVRVKSGMQQNHVMAFLKEVPEAEKEVANIISNIFTALNVSGGPIARYLAQGDKNQAMQLIAQSNVNNYLAQKRQSGNLLGILFLDLNKQAFTFIKEVSDLEGTGLRLHAKTNYLITTVENPFANTSIVDTGA